MLETHQLQKKKKALEVFTVKNNKIAMRTGDDKQIQDDDKIRIYPFGSNVPYIKYCEGKLYLLSLLY